ncbi:MAG TPA: hypothetical protein VFQ76_18360 [Longimicrobiaceae bacterium]|nr:hypothetical protein [Longimicrobiaceae bacterium]
MSTSYYRLTVVACALSWFLVGLHLPALHAMTHHGGAPHWPVVAIVTLLAAAAVAGLWILLRAPLRRTA